MDKHCKTKIFAGFITLMTLNLGSALAQNVVKGVVTNSSTGDKFVGASIVVEGTQATAMTDERGMFELSNVDLRGVLRIEAPGCELQYVPLRGRSQVNVTLMPKNTRSLYDNTSLSAKAQSRIIDMGNATLSPNEIIGMGASGNVRDIARSGVDASGSTLFIRGLHSLNMSSHPLFIVDGVIWQTQEGISSIHEGFFSNPLALISPDDIESIQVLKNGTAIYGAKAANGVIVINTKRCRNMATEITVNMSVGIKSPFKTIPMMNATDYRIYATDMMRGLANQGIDINQYDFINDDASKSSYLSAHNQTDWLNEINKSGLTQDYNVSIRGGDDVALYSFSVGYAHNEGNIEHTDFERLNVRFNSDIKLTKRLFTRADISFSQVTRNLFDDGINAYTSPLYLAYVKSPLYNPYQFDASGKIYEQLSDKDELGIGNPLAITDNADGKTKNYRFTAAIQPKYKFSEPFTLSATVAFSFDKIKESSFTPDFGLAEVQLYNTDDDWYGEGLNCVSSFMTRHSTLTLGMNADWSPLKSLHSLNVMGGFRFLNDTYESDFGKGYNTGSDNLKSLSVTQSSLRTMDGVDEEWRSLAWYASADYNFLNRYFLTASLSMESNSRFGKNAGGALRMSGITWGIFPSVNTAWVVSNENFMRNLRGINYLRLRASFESTGNDDLPSNAVRTYFQTVGYAGLAKGLVLANIGNNTLKWETTATFNLGMDMNLFGNRLSLGADVFISRTSNLLVRKTLRDEFGLSSYWANSGELRNSGFEVNADARIINTRNWEVNAGLSIGHYKNKVKSLGGENYILSLLGAEILTAENHPLGVFYGYKNLGVFSSQREADAANLGIINKTGQKVAFGAGDMRFEDVNNDGIINESDRQIIGDPNPSMYGHFNFALRYKALSLDAVFTYSLGNDAYNALRASLESGSNLYNQTTEMANRWRADGQKTSVPRATYGDPMGNGRFSDRWIEDASYLKLRQLRTTYTLPIKPKFIQGASVWVAVNNVFTISKYLGADPEFCYGSSAIYQGVDSGLTPSTRSYHFGVKLNL